MKFRGEDLERKFNQTSLVFQAAAWLFADASLDAGVMPIILSFNDKLFYGRAQAQPFIVFLDSFGRFARYNEKHLGMIRARLVAELGDWVQLRYLKRGPGNPSRIWFAVPRQYFERSKNGRVQKEH